MNALFVDRELICSETGEVVAGSMPACMGTQQAEIFLIPHQHVLRRLQRSHSIFGTDRTLLTNLISRFCSAERIFCRFSRLPFLHPHKTLCGGENCVLNFLRVLVSRVPGSS